MNLIQTLARALHRKLRRLICPQIVLIVITRRSPIRQQLPHFRNVRMSALEAARHGQLSLL